MDVGKQSEELQQIVELQTKEKNDLKDNICNSDSTIHDETEPMDRLVCSNEKTEECKKINSQKTNETITPTNTLPNDIKESSNKENVLIASNDFDDEMGDDEELDFLDLTQSANNSFIQQNNSEIIEDEAILSNSTFNNDDDDEDEYFIAATQELEGDKENKKFIINVQSTTNSAVTTVDTAIAATQKLENSFNDKTEKIEEIFKKENFEGNHPQLYIIFSLFLFET